MLVGSSVCHVSSTFGGQSSRAPELLSLSLIVSNCRRNDLASGMGSLSC
jgi:hypothetical protein